MNETGRRYMKAIVYHNYGPPDVLSYTETEKPIPTDDQVLIKVRAASVNTLDRMHEGRSIAIRLMITGLNRPKDIRLGRDVAGEVEAVGKNIARFKPGDAVFGWCQGAFAEYACASESALAIKPNNITFDEAASVPVAANTALQALRDKGKIQPGQKVLINGSTGAIGTFAVQIAKAFDAEVTAVCKTQNLDLVRSIGADHVIDYTNEDFTQSAQRYDLIVDVIGNHSLSAMRRVLTPGGACILVGGPTTALGLLAHVLKARLYSKFVRQRFEMLLAALNHDDLTFLHGFLEAGKIKPIIDRRYTLSEVPDAIRYLAEGHARGKIVVTLANNKI
jgi:NADPH:quinone reductase-like Zn-dependent oxidoreductase